MSISELLFLYSSTLLGAVAILAFLTQLRRRRFGPTPSEDHIFRCAGCGYVYTDDPDVDRSRCPQCGVTNEMYKF